MIRRTGKDRLLPSKKQKQEKNRTRTLFFALFLLPFLFYAHLIAPLSHPVFLFVFFFFTSLFLVFSHYPIQSRTFRSRLASGGEQSGDSIRTFRLGYAILAITLSEGHYR